MVIPDNIEELDIDELFTLSRSAGIVLTEGNTRESLIRQLRRMQL